MSLNERVARIEATVDVLAKTQVETRDEFRQFRHDLFGLINPLLQKTSKLESDIEWMDKTRKWTPFLKIGGAGGLISLFVEIFSRLTK